MEIEKFFQFEREQDTFTLSVYATKFSLLDKAYTLVAFQNIKDELEAQEVESWQKTHPGTHS